MKRSTWLFLLLSGALALPAACNKEELQTTYNKQEANIASFISTIQKRDTTATVTITEGVYRLTQHDTLNLPDSLLWGGKVTLRYAWWPPTCVPWHRPPAGPSRTPPSSNPPP